MTVVTRKGRAALRIVPVALAASAMLAGYSRVPGAGASPTRHARATAVPASATTDARTLPPAPVWKTAPRATPQRPASCAPLPSSPADKRTGSVAAHANPDQTTPTGDPLWPPLAATTNPEDYVAYKTPRTSPLTVPENFDNSSNNWKLSSTRDPVEATASNPQELCGVEGLSADEAWQISTGRPTTVVAVLDSGIDWCQPDIVEKLFFNRDALPLPENAGGMTKPQLEAAGQAFTDSDPYDLDDSGIFDVAQYANDPRVATVAAAYGGLFCTQNDDSGYSGISPEDLIRAFSDPTYPDGTVNPYALHRQSPTGYNEAISGWNILDNNNDPYDDVHYGHGTGEAMDMAGEADGPGEVGACPNCMIMPVRVGTSFISTGDDFAEGAIFAVDAGATVISEALGTFDYTASAQQAVAYAASHGVPIVGSAADEASEHQNLPASIGHIIVANSSNSEPDWTPSSYLYLNGCTNYGAAISITVPSASCSSEATGKTAGSVGLAESAAVTAMDKGIITPYPGLTNAAGGAVPLSANEIMQLVTMSADSVDFATAAPNADPPAPADNYAVQSSTVPFGTTTMYPTTPGYNIYTGYGRINTDRMLQWISEGRIPPEAEIDSPDPFVTMSPTEQLTVSGLVGAVRSSSYRYQVDVGVGAAPLPGSWKLAAEGSGTGSTTGILASIPLSEVAALFPGGDAGLKGGPVGPKGAPDPDKFGFSIRIIVEDASGLVGEAQQEDYLHIDTSLVDGYPLQLSGSIVGPPRLAPIGPDGEDALVVAQADGTIDAFLPNGHQLPGWPVHTDLAPLHLKEAAYASGFITAKPRGEIVGGVAVGDLADASGHNLDVVAADVLGNAYAWNSAGKLLPGWPVHSDPNYSLPSARNADNRLLPGFLAAPALGDLTGDGQLDVVEPSMDRHVYAWGPGGDLVAGWPVLVVDPSEVQSVDPETNQVTFLPTADPGIGTELIDTPAIGSLTGKGLPQVILGSDEEYPGTPNANLGALGQLLGLSGATAVNSRVYAIWADGSNHPAATGAPDPPGFPDPGAFVPGWPVAITQLDEDVLPTIGDGIGSSPALADLSGDGELNVVTSTVAGPIYVLDPDGTSELGDTDGVPNVAAFQTSSKESALSWTLPALGGISVGALGAADSPPSIVAAAGSLGRLLDEAYPGLQTPNENQVGAWNPITGALVTGFPAEMNDVQFFVQPIIADVAGSADGGYAVQVSGLGDLRAYGATGKEAPGFPKFDGGWVTFGPGYGPWGTLGTQVLAAGNREGELFVWNTPTPACSSSGPWPQVYHDLWNTGNLDEQGAPVPSCVQTTVDKR